MNMYAERRRKLIQSIQNSEAVNDCVLLVSAQYEHPRYRFLQDSTFYYLTGLHEPGAILLLDISKTKDGGSIVYVPLFAADRTLWTQIPDSSLGGVDVYEGLDVQPLGAPGTGYSATPYFTPDTHLHVTMKLQEALKNGRKVGVCDLYHRGSHAVQRRNIEQLMRHIPALQDQLFDCSAHIAQLRRKKSAYEISQLQQAIAITADALSAARQVVHAGSTESAVHAQLVATMVNNGAGEAFPSIVASGLNGTVLHYEHNSALLCAGDLLIIDCGAAWNGYAADISRTFAVSDVYTPRQRMLYNVVLEVQQLVRSSARPGMWLRNAQEPERSLHHIAVRQFTEHGLGHYFPHSIGHFLGLDVHDIGDIQEPLAAGDVITIEPGLYIREEKTGIRIEDDFLITETGTTCLSDAIPRGIWE